MMLHSRTLPRCGTRQASAHAQRLNVRRFAVVSPTAESLVTPEIITSFQRDGFVVLRNVISDKELKEAIDPVYFKFINGEIEVPGRDKSDMSVKSAGREDPEDFSLFNVMLPSTYYPAWQGNVLQQKCEALAKELLETDEVDLDFDQILAKRPKTPDSGMPWHQDAASWPPELDGVNCSGTANMWVAISDVPVESGCLRYIPGSHLEGSLRPHESVGAEDSPVLRAVVGSERAQMIPLKRGDIVVHSERVVHGSGPNMTENWRCGYILNYKKSTCVMDERALGFTHSLNDKVYNNTKQ